MSGNRTLRPRREIVLRREGWRTRVSVYDNGLLVDWWTVDDEEAQVLPTGPNVRWTKSL